MLGTVAAVPPPLQTDRLSLRPLRAGDAEVLWRLWDDPEVYAYVGTGDVPGLDRLERGVEAFVRMYAERGWGPLAVARREDGVVIGECGLYPWRQDGVETGEVELGYRYGRAHWGQGYGREAAAAVLRWARDELGCNELVCSVQEPNVASRRIAEGLGFRLVALRERRAEGRVWLDCWYVWSGSESGESGSAAGAGGGVAGG